MSLGLGVAWAWIAGQEWFRKVVVLLGLVLAALLALAGVRRQGERAGRLVEREVHRAEARKTEKRVEQVKKKMEDVPRPGRSDAAGRLRKGDF